MATKKITELTADTTVQPSDLVVTVDMSDSTTKKVTLENVVVGLNSLIATISGSTFTGPITAQVTGSLTRTSAGTPFITVPAGNVITITTGSAGQIVLSGSGGSGGSSDLTPYARLDGATFTGPVTASLGLSASFLQVGTANVASAGDIRAASGFSIKQNVNNVDRPIIAGSTSAEVILGGAGANECSAIVNRVASAGGAIYNQIAGVNYWTVASASLTAGAPITGQVTGSLTRTAVGTPYITAPANNIITVTTASNGQIIISGSGDGTGAAAGGAPTTALYLTLATDGTLSNERVFTPGTGLNGTDAGANSSYTLSINDGVVATISGSKFSGPVTASLGVHASDMFSQGRAPATSGSIRFTADQGVTTHFMRYRQSGTDYDLLQLDTAGGTLTLGDSAHNTLVQGYQTGIVAKSGNQISFTSNGTTSAIMTNAAVTMYQPTTVQSYLSATHIIVNSSNDSTSTGYLAIGGTNVPSTGMLRLGSDTGDYRSLITVRQNGLDWDFLEIHNAGASYINIGPTTAAGYSVALRGYSIAYNTNAAPGAHTFYVGATNAFNIEQTVVTSKVPLSASAGLTGSLQQIASGLSYLVAGNGTNITSASNGQVTITSANPTHVGHRLTLSSSVPVTTSDVVSGSTLYMTAHNSNEVALYSGTTWQVYKTDEVSLALSGLTAGTNYDVFCYPSGGTPTLELTAWSSATARATSLTRQDGVLVRSGATSRRYMGTIRAASATTTNDNRGQRFVWNFYNRVPRTLRRQETTNTWTYTGTLRAANSSSANRVELVCGEDLYVDIVVQGMATYTQSNWGASVEIGIDSTTVGSADLKSGGYTVANAYNWPRAEYRGAPGVGYHAFYWLEQAGASVDWKGDNNDPSYFQAGILGTIMG